MKCKVINSSKNLLENTINNWLESGKFSIIKITQTESANNGYITVTILYEDLKETRKRKLDKLDLI